MPAIDPNATPVGLLESVASTLSSIPSTGVAAVAGSAALAFAALAIARRRQGTAIAGAPRSDAGTASQPSTGAFESVPVALLAFDAQGRLLRHNREAQELLQLPQVLRGETPLHWTSIFGPDSLEEITRALAQAERTELEVAKGSGVRRRWLDLHAARTAEGVELWVEDATDRKAAEGELRHLALHDPLTGLLNRHGFEAQRRLALDAARAGVPIALAYLDLDRFKPVNDIFGHAAGDHVLRQVATRLQEHVRAPHALARIGGDEFVMLFVGIPLGEAHVICRAALDAVRGSAYEFEDKAFGVDGSIGLAAADVALLDERVIEACDRACAEAKRDGGGRVVVADDDALEAQERWDEQRLVGVLSAGPGDGRLATQMQPIVSLRQPEGSLNYEVLARLFDEHGDAIPASRFMQAAQRNGLTSELDRRVLRLTLEWLDEHAQHRERVSFAALNICRASLADERFVDDVRSMLREHRAATHRICFEISERAAIEDPKGVRRFMETVKALGARLALDDFGAEYASLSCVRQLRSDFVKIDAALIRGIDSNPASFSIVRSIVDACHDLGVSCIAESAQTDAIVRTLLDLEIDFAQGYAFSRPLAVQQLLEADHCASLIADPQIASLLRHDRNAPTRQFDLARRDPALR